MPVICSLLGVKAASSFSQWGEKKKEQGKNSAKIHRKSWGEKNVLLDENKLQRVGPCSDQGLWTSWFQSNLKFLWKALSMQNGERVFQLSKILQAKHRKIFLESEEVLNTINICSCRFCFPYKKLEYIGDEPVFFLIVWHVFLLCFNVFTVSLENLQLICIHHL